MPVASVWQAWPSVPRARAPRGDEGGACRENSDGVVFTASKRTGANEPPSPIVGEPPLQTEPEIDRLYLMLAKGPVPRQRHRTRVFAEHREDGRDAAQDYHDGGVGLPGGTGPRAAPCGGFRLRTRHTSAKPIERSPWIHQSLDWRADLQEQRAQELEALADQLPHRQKHLKKLATWIRTCGSPTANPPYRRCRCNKHCPRCSEFQVGIERKKARAAIKGMEASRPHVVIFSVRSRHRRDLRRTLSELRDCLVKLRQRKSFRAVRGGVGGIDCKVTENGEALNCHLHAVVDAPPTLALEPIARDWKGLTRGLGTFKAHDSGRFVDRDDPSAIERVIEYDIKERDRCPTPGEVDLQHLAVLYSGLRRKQLFVAWGTARVPRRARTARAVP